MERGGRRATERGTERGTEGLRERRKLAATASIKMRKGHPLLNEIKRKREGEGGREREGTNR